MANRNVSQRLRSPQTIEMVIQTIAECVKQKDLENDTEDFVMKEDQ